MKTKSESPSASRPACTSLTAAAVFALIALLAVSAGAAPFHAPVLDGLITGDGTDWDETDHVVNDYADEVGTAQNVRHLWLTWDADNLYVGVVYEDFSAELGLRVYLDLDKSPAGPTSAAVLDSFGGQFDFPADGQFDLVLGRSLDQIPGTVPPRARLVTGTDGATTSIDAQVTVVQALQYGGTKTGEKYFVRNDAEFALPWSVLYPSLGGEVSPNAVIRAVALIGAGADSNGVDCAPNNPGMDRGIGTVDLLNFHASVIDADGDGVPDASDATVSGTVTLPGDDLDTPVTVVAELIDFAGRTPGAPLSRITTAADARAWTLPRLPAGRYRITTSALGYFADSVVVDVLESGANTGVDQTLTKATGISGTISFASGPGRDGTVNLLAGGEVVATGAFTVGDPTYQFFVEAGGDYVVAAEAGTYLPLETPVTVTTGQDAVVDVTLQRQTEISGTVSMLDGPGKPGMITLTNEDGEVVGEDGFGLAGEAFEFFTPVGGRFTLTTLTEPPIYVAADTTITVTAGVDVTGLEINLVLAAFVDGTIAFEGPDVAGRGELFNDVSGAWRDSLDFTTAGDAFDFYLEPGRFRLELNAPGYEDRSIVFNTTTADTSLGALLLTAVRATHLEIIDDDGLTRPEVRATYYNPATDPWTSSRVLLAARDDLGRDDLYDLDARLSDFHLSALKMDDLSPPTGQPVFYRTANQADVDDVVDFVDGRAQFWASDTAVEVLRVYLAQPDKAPIAGRIVVAFQDPQPTTVVLSAARDTLVADAVDRIVVHAQLYDSAENLAELPDIPITFALTPGSNGAGQFEVATVVTNGFGWAEASLTATGAGSLDVTASVVIGNRVLDVVGTELNSGETTLSLTAIAGAVAGWDLSLPSNLSDLQTPVTVQVQLVDAFDNDVAEAGHTAGFSADPAALGAFSPLTAVTDADGRASAEFLPSGQAGLVTLRAGGGGLTEDNAGLELRNVTVIPDAVFYDEPDNHSTFAAADLTALIVNNTPNSLLFEVPFSSDLNGMQLHLVLETGFDAEGATSDPFQQPVNYGHADKPDYALTYKYSVDDWGDFRKSIDGAWHYWNFVTEAYEPGDPVGDANIKDRWVDRSGGLMRFVVPFSVLGDRPDSLRFELYLTQEDGVKRAAFDSCPQDSTLDLDFDPYDGLPGEWALALGPSTLEAWGPTYVVKTDFPTPPTVTETTATPNELMAGEVVRLTAQITDTGDGVGDVLADLSAMGGGELVRMYDDGDAQHADAVAGDGRFGLLTMVPVGNPGGSQNLRIFAYDAGNELPMIVAVAIDVTPIVEPIVQVADRVGDDHGPNQPGQARKFITYPTNIAFVNGAFDLTGLTIFETTFAVGGEPIEMIAFQVSLVDFPDPDDPGTADWSPLYADLNIEKIDILIDSAPGGATTGLPNRRADFQPWDAWDYAVVMDGWYKAVIPSLGRNTLDSWRENALRTDKDILLLGDPDLNTVTALVSKAALGDPTPEDIQSWDIAVCVSSHDFGGEEVLGGIRWVNESRSEWNFGGGAEGDRDPNLIDLLLIPGTGHEAGLPQEEILDYESPDALARLEQGLTPVAIEISQFEDTGPPVIDTGGKGSVVTRVAPLADAPVVVAVEITDDNRVEAAKFRYRSTSFAGEGWDREVDMGFLGRDLWVVDILPSYLDSLIASPIDTTRYLEFEVWAVDPLGKEATSAVTTLQIMPPESCRPADATLDSEGLSLLQVDGSTLLVPDALRGRLIEEHVAETWTGEAVSPDTMGSRIELQWDVCSVPPDIEAAPSVPPARPIGVFREVYLATADSLGGFRDWTEPLPSTLSLSLHYPQAWLPQGVDEDRIALYEYHDGSDRWVLVGGNVTPTGNNVTATLNRAGSYGLFLTDSIEVDKGEVLSGIMISPNPFSPNGDGLYDETNISFYLTDEATVTVEIYNIQGSRKRVLTETFSYTGADVTDPAPRRVPGLIWDGRDFAGDVVPYGVYIMRVIATYNQAGGTRTIRSNYSVAVIK